MRTRAFLLVVLVSILPIIIVSAQEAKKPLTLEALFASATFFGNPFQGGQWADEGPVITYVQPDPATAATNLVQLDLSSNTQTTLIAGNRLTAPDVNRLITIEDYAYSADGSTALLYTDSAPVWRLNTQGFYYLYDVAEETLTPLSSREAGYQMFAKMSPNGQYAAFVRKRNLFLVELATMEETQLTFDGAEGTLINGTTDWVYEEEFGLRDGFAWSPDSRHLAFIKMDESNTSDFTMLDLRGLKPEPITFRFPLAGEANSEIQVGIIDMASLTTRYFDTNTWFEGGDTHEYIPRFGWTPAIDGQPQVWMVRLNRDQNVLDLLYGNPVTHEVETILQEQEETWVNVGTGFGANAFGKVAYLDDGERFLWQSEESGFNHLYLYTNAGERLKQITAGDWEVTAVHGVNTQTGQVYFTSTAASPIERHLYRTTLNAPSPATPIRITQEPGTHTVNLSADLRYYTDAYSTRSTPPVTRLHRIDGSAVETLEPNMRLINTLAEHDWPTTEFMTLPGADGTALHAYMIKPSDFDPSKTYPLLVFTYGGPEAQEVTDAWNGFFDLWHAYLASEKDILVACVDNRGANGYGKAFETPLYRQMGTVEAQDQLAAAKYWGNLPYVDADRIGMWGWSYGGFNTLNAMLKYDGPETIKVGMAVAPGTDWRLYDTIYTERYMSTPQKNAQGYDAGAPKNFVQNLRDDQHLLILQGTLDDNVHLQNTIHLVDALQKANKHFELMLYPGGNHGMVGTNNPYTYLHLFTTLTNFLEENL